MRDFDLAFVESTVAAAAAAYADGDQVGVMLDLGDVFKDRGGVAKLKQLTVLDEAGQKINGDVFFFRSVHTTGADAAPTVTSVDNGAFALSAANLAFCVGKVNVPAANYAATSAQAVATVQTDLPFFASKGSKRLYCMFVTRGAPTYTANGVKLKLGFEKP